MRRVWSVGGWVYANNFGEGMKLYFLPDLALTNLGWYAIKQRNQTDQCLLGIRTKLLNLTQNIFFYLIHFQEVSIQRENITTLWIYFYVYLCLKMQVIYFTYLLTVRQWSVRYGFNPIKDFENGTWYLLA